jgi:hypothetical protein
MYLVDEAAKKYTKEFSSTNDVWHQLFPIDVRREVAKDLRDSFEDDVKTEEYDFQEMIPKKYRGKPLTL